MSKKNIFIIAGVLFFILYTVLVIFGFNFFLSKGNSQNPTNGSIPGSATISGTIDLNGVPPTNAIIQLLTKEIGQQSSFQESNISITATDGISWQFQQAQSGKEYAIKAVIKSGNTIVGTSQTLLVTAPADSEKLRINITNASSEKNIPSALSGILNLNGYIPNGSTITIQQRKNGESNFSNVVTNISAVDNGAWSWTNAIQNTAYEIQAQLVANGSVAATSQVIQMTAPATNEQITINSPLSPPAPQIVQVSGTFNINGIIPNNSSITLLARQTGTSTFNQVATGLNATDGGTWSYTQASSGTSYDFQAQLVSNGTVTSTSQILTVAAPATGETLTLNAQAQPPTPSANGMTNTCASANGTSWQVTFTYNNNSLITNAQQYQLQVGISSTDSSIINSTFTPTNPNSSQTYTSGYQFNQGQTYYARWAYATCQNCNSFSQFSPNLQFYCNPGPTNTPTPIPTSTPYPTYTPYPTNTPVPTNTPIPTNTPVPPTNPAPTN